jgi:hypothetical protein
VRAEGRIVSGEIIRGGFRKTVIAQLISGRREYYKAKSVFVVIFLVSSFALRQNIKLPTNATNKSHIKQTTTKMPLRFFIPKLQQLTTSRLRIIFTPHPLL